MSTESKGKNRLNDMSFDPATVPKGKTQATEVTESGKVLKVRKARKDPKYYPSHHKGHGKVSNWVCVKLGDEVRRVQRATVNQLIEQGWNFCPKKEWKAKVNGVALTGLKVNELGAVVAHSKKGKSLKGT